MSTDVHRDTVDAPPVEGITTIHLYPRGLPYRRSGSASIPQIGDVALCGWVKQRPQRPGGYPPGSANCLMCVRLNELGLGRAAS